MRIDKVYDSERYKVFSYGNGWAYGVIRKTDSAELWVQDEDATEFSRIFEQDRSYDEAISDYDDVMRVSIYASGLTDR